MIIERISINVDCNNVSDNKDCNHNKECNNVSDINLFHDKRF